MITYYLSIFSSRTGNMKFAVDFHQHLFTLNAFSIPTGMLSAYAQHWMRLRAVSKVNKYPFAHCWKSTAKFILSSTFDKELKQSTTIFLIKCCTLITLRLFFLNSEIQINFPHFTGQSYLQVKTSQPINYIDLTFATEHHNGLLLYCDDKSREFYFIISIRNQIIDIT
jgi:hypothetical protein